MVARLQKWKSQHDQEDISFYDLASQVTYATSPIVTGDPFYWRGYRPHLSVRGVVTLLHCEKNMWNGSSYDAILENVFCHSLKQGSSTESWVGREICTFLVYFGVSGLRQRWGEGWNSIIKCFNSYLENTKMFSQHRLQKTKLNKVFLIGRNTQTLWLPGGHIRKVWDFYIHKRERAWV